MTRRFMLANYLALASLALCLSAGLAKAQGQYQGKFTLPFEARWGGAVLPPGTYTFKIPSAVTPYRLFLRGENKTAMVMSKATSTKVASEHSQLTLVDNGGIYAVRRLEAPELGLTFDYAVPKGGMKQMAQSHEPTRQIPVTAGGK